MIYHKSESIILNINITMDSPSPEGRLVGHDIVSYLKGCRFKLPLVLLG